MNSPAYILQNYSFSLFLFLFCLGVAATTSGTAGKIPLSYNDAAKMSAEIPLY